MLNLPTLIFELAIADLRTLSDAANQDPLRARDLAAARKLMAAALRFHRANDEFDVETIGLMAEIAARCVAFTGRHLKAVRAEQMRDKTKRLSNLDLAAMSLYQRALRLEELMSEILDSADPDQDGLLAGVLGNETDGELDGDESEALSGRPASPSATPVAPPLPPHLARLQAEPLPAPIPASEASRQPAAA
jgi:hypothetical protein